MTTYVSNALQVNQISVMVETNEAIKESSTNSMGVSIDVLFFPPPWLVKIHPPGNGNISHLRKFGKSSFLKSAGLLGGDMDSFQEGITTVSLRSKIQNWMCLWTSVVGLRWCHNES